jgi:hypothetical protein
MPKSHLDGSNVAPSSNDFHVLPATEKQILFAQQIAKRLKIDLPLTH